MVFRPPYSHTHPVTISTFITEFANLLESVVLLNVLNHQEQTRLPLSLKFNAMLPIISKMVNLSLQSGVFAMTWKNALVCQLLKKPWHGSYNFEELSPA